MVLPSAATGATVGTIKGAGAGIAGGAGLAAGGAAIENARVATVAARLPAASIV